MEFNEELTDALRDCILHHQEILKFCIMLENFFHLFVLVKSIQITSQICSLAFVASKVGLLCRQFLFYIKPKKKTINYIDNCIFNSGQHK